MKRKLIAVIAALLLAAGLVWAFAPRPIEVEVVAASKGHFQRTVDEDARTRLVDRYVVSAPIAGQVERIRLREGDPVTAGDVVATILPSAPAMLDARTEQQQVARVATAEAAIARSRARVDRSKVAVDQAKSDLVRSEQLAAQGFVSPNKLESDRLSLLAAERELDTAKQDQHIASHDFEEARAALRQYQSPSLATRGKSWPVRSPISGRVLRIAQSSEGVVGPGTALVEIGDLARLEVVAEILTTDALQMPQGTRVLLERWGGPGTLEGRVRAIDPAAFTKISALGVEEQRVLVRMDVTSPRERWQALGDGFRMSMRAIVQEANDAIKVPVSAVFPSNGKMAVFVLDGGRVSVTPVELGARNGMEAWIKSGLAEGTQVVTYPPPNIKDGAKVKPRTA